MTATEDVLAANAAAEGPGELPAQPARRIAIVTCMDARIDPMVLFGLAAGDAHVIRNAGGIVTDDVERSIAVSQRALGTVEVMVVHHRGCGMQGERDLGFTPPWPMGFFDDLEQDVRTGVARLRSSPALRHTDRIHGFVLDTASGRLSDVV